MSTSSNSRKQVNKSKITRGSDKILFTRSGISIHETYWPKDCPQSLLSDPQRALGEPGSYPFVRGIQKDMYRGKFWTMRQYAGFGTAKESNKRYHYLLTKSEKGNAALSVAFDLPTQLGYDPDHPHALGEVGKVGVSISTIDDMRTLFHGIPLSQVSTSMTINATASILLAFYVAIAQENQCSLSELRGTVQNDILKEYIARGNYIYPLDFAMRLTTDLIRWSVKNIPKWNPISISGYHIREAGSTAIQELAFTFANAKAYVQATLALGLSLDTFAKQISFFFNVHSDFFEEIAKFRAARKLWSHIMREQFGAKDLRATQLRFHAQTAGSTLTAQQTDNNVVRVSLQALAAVLGGAQSIHTNSRDEALALPTEASVLLALRTQQIIAHESNVTQSVDPLGGSWFMENLTEELYRNTLIYLDNIEKRGGALRCIESGFIQSEISDSAYRDQNKVDRGEIKVVGVNCLNDDNMTSKKSISLLRVSEKIEKDAVEKIKAFRRKRSQSEVSLVLKNLKEAALTADCLQTKILAAVNANATLGEISDTLRSCFGIYRGTSGF